MEIDSRFRPVGTLGQEDPVNGAALPLTIDVDDMNHPTKRP